ncbi:glycosyltransferase [Neorhodopirellula lusitana]|nr:glycosyltransferase [Neorhodopirellula lusitana]
MSILGSSPQGSSVPERKRRNGQRVLWVTRRFWPHVYGRHARASASYELVRRWSAAGYDMQVVTPRFSGHWSEGFAIGEIPVHRIVAAPKGEWSMQRYVRYLGNWIIEQLENFDAIVCDGLSDEVRSVAMAVTHARKQQNAASPLASGFHHVPTAVAICDGWGGDADEVWCRQARGGRRVLASLAELDCVVTRHAGADRFLVAHEIPSERIQRIPRGFARPERWTLKQRSAARKSLASANHDLTAGPEDRVLLWCGEMRGRPDREEGVVTLVKNARLLCGRYPNLRIWLLGDGELHDWAHRELKAEGVRSVVAIPGTFSDMTDVWRSVDFVAATCEDHLRYVLPKAIESAVAVLVADQPPMREWVQTYFEPAVADSFAWYEPKRIASFRKTFRMLWEELPDVTQHAWEIANEAAHRFHDNEEMHRWAEILSPRRS